MDAIFVIIGLLPQLGGLDYARFHTELSGTEFPTILPFSARIPLYRRCCFKLVHWSRHWFWHLVLLLQFRLLNGRTVVVVVLTDGHLSQQFYLGGRKRPDPARGVGTTLHSQVGQSINIPTVHLGLQLPVVVVVAVAVVVVVVVIVVGCA